MEDTETKTTISRRDLLMNTGKSAIAVGGLALSAAVLAESKAEASPVIASDKAASPNGVHLGTDHLKQTLVRIARDIYPHDKLPDKYYSEPVFALLSTDHDLLVEGVVELNELSMSRIGSSFVDVSLEADRVRLLRSIEEGPFFSKIKGTMMLGIYDNKEVWPFFGYEGSSWEKGGYLNRGFNDIDWL